MVNANYPVPLGLKSGHMQSAYSRLLLRRYNLDDLAPARRLSVPTDDGSGDRLTVNIHASDVTGAGLVLLVHGLGGSAESAYIRATSVAMLMAGFSVARVDLRCAGDSKQTSTLTYHAGKTDDLRAVLRRLADEPEAGVKGSDPALAVLGFSLGGAMTIKLLGEPREGLPLRAGVTVSAPLDLVAGAEHLSNAAFGMYERAVLRGLREDLRSRAPDGSVRLTPAEQRAVRRARRLPDFDNAITAPWHGWRDAREYYEVNSAGRYLPTVDAPLLLIHALDDPMIPADSYLAIDWQGLAAAGYVHRAITAHGGHVGFHQGGGRLPWYASQAVRFLAQHMPAS